MLFPQGKSSDGSFESSHYVIHRVTVDASLSLKFHLAPPQSLPKVYFIDEKKTIRTTVTSKYLCAVYVLMSMSS